MTVRSCLSCRENSEDRTLVPFNATVGRRRFQEPLHCDMNVSIPETRRLLPGEAPFAVL